jgi:hypothetical protein
MSILERNEEPEFFRKQDLLPYQIQRIEYRREHPISVDDDVDEDLLIREIHYFHDLNEVEEYVGGFGHSLEDIKWLSEINPP